MSDIDILEKIVYPAVDEANVTLPEGKSMTKSPDTLLFGEGGAFDSLGLVRFIVSVEDHIRRQTGKPLRLASKSAMSRSDSPFRNIQALADYVKELLLKDDTQ